MAYRKKKKVLITGANGQLGQCIHLIKDNYPELELCFTNSQELDISQLDAIKPFFQKNSYNFVINCAAYTNVEQAEKESDKAFLVNADGVKNLAEVCMKNSVVLIHISTDYVFDGKKNSPYTEEDIPNPINEYGKSKLSGERYVEEFAGKYFIIRTSWLYSQYGKNFYKTILEKTSTEKKLTITTSETGTPTSANDLAEFIITIIKSNSSEYGIYHFSNEGEATWYDFAYEIVKISNKLDTIDVEKGENYHTFAQRPKYSVLNKNKSIESFGLNILNWKDSFKKLHSNTR